MLHNTGSSKPSVGKETAVSAVIKQVAAEVENQIAKLSQRSTTQRLPLMTTSRSAQAVAATSATDVKIVYVDVTAEFAGHGIGSTKPFINDIRAGAADAFHPNADGYLAYADAISAAGARRMVGQTQAAGLSCAVNRSQRPRDVRLCAERKIRRPDLPFFG